MAMTPAVETASTAPPVSRADWQQVFALLDTALELDPEAQRAWLASLGAEQAHLSPMLAQLLQTRSEVERERQNQALLASLDRRQGMQLRLQETVEGLSVIAMTYYGVGLSGYLLKPLAKAVGASESLVTLLAVPVIACASGWSKRAEPVCRWRYYESNRWMRP